MSLQDDDDFYLLMLGITSSGAILAFAGVLAARWWDTATSWMLTHHLIVPADHRPTVALPGADGAGLDMARLGMAIGLAIVFLVLLIAAARRAMARRAAR